MEATLVEIKPEVKELILKSEVLSNRLQDYRINTPEQFEFAAEDLKTSKAMIDELTKTRKTITDPLDIAKEKTMALFRVPINRLMSIRETIDRAMTKFKDDEEKKRQEAEAKAAEKNAKKVETLETKAEEAEKSGDLAKADKLRAKAQDVQTAAPLVETKVPKVDGLATRVNWKYRVVNAALVPRKFLIPNDKLLGDTARSTKGTIKVPGIVFYAEKTNYTRNPREEA